MPSLFSLNALDFLLFYMHQLPFYGEGWLGIFTTFLVFAHPENWKWNIMFFLIWHLPYSSYFPSHSFFTKLTETNQTILSTEGNVWSYDPHSPVRVPDNPQHVLSVAVIVSVLYEFDCKSWVSSCYLQQVWLRKTLLIFWIRRNVRNTWLLSVMPNGFR